MLQPPPTPVHKNTLLVVLPPSKAYVLYGWPLCTIEKVKKNKVAEKLEKIWKISENLSTKIWQIPCNLLWVLDLECKYFWFSKPQIISRKILIQGHWRKVWRSQNLIRSYFLNSLQLLTPLQWKVSHELYIKRALTRKLLIKPFQKNTVM